MANEIYLSMNNGNQLHHTLKRIQQSAKEEEKRDGLSSMLVYAIKDKGVSGEERILLPRRRSTK